MNVGQLATELAKVDDSWPVRLWCEGVEMTVKEVRVDTARHIVILAKVTV